MSTTTADILEGVTRLVHALDELLKTQTVEALVDLVRQLGIGEPVKTALQGLTRVLDLVSSWIGKLEQVAAIPRVLENLEPAFEGLQALGGSSAESMRQMGLEALAPMAEAAGAALSLLDKVRQGAATILQGYLPEEALKNLRASVTDITATLRTLGERLVQGDAKAASPARAASGSTPALATGGIA